MPPLFAYTPAEGPAPDPATATPGQLVEHFFRHESGRLHGALVRVFGVQNLALAEDVTQEAMLRALRGWAMGGVPANPSAWITRVAMNLARDALRHGRMAMGKEGAIITHLELGAVAEDPRTEPHAIRDDALRLLFVCCHPEVPPDAQVVLALKVLCGFGMREIAQAFLATEAAIEKQLTRTKARIRDAGLGFDLPIGACLGERLDGVLGALYLLFNEGYKATAGDRLLREELCQEAMRLLALVLEHPAGDTPRSHALMALMRLNAARFPTRLDGEGALLRLEEQDRSRWDSRLIAQGLTHLARAATGDELSEYHLQAGIAACHCTAADFASTDWGRILRHYDALLARRASPIVELNRAVVVAQVAGPQAGLAALMAIHHRPRVESLHLLHAVEGELHWRLGAYAEAAACFRQALRLARVGPEQAYLERRLAQPVPSNGATG